MHPEDTAKPPQDQRGSEEVPPASAINPKPQTRALVPQLGKPNNTRGIGQPCGPGR